MKNFFLQFEAMIVTVNVFFGFLVAVAVGRWLYREIYWYRKRNAMRHLYFTQVYGKDYKQNLEYKAFVNRLKKSGLWDNYRGGF